MLMPKHPPNSYPREEEIEAKSSMENQPQTGTLGNDPLVRAERATNMKHLGGSPCISENAGRTTTYRRLPQYEHADASRSYAHTFGGMKRFFVLTLFPLRPWPLFRQRAYVHDFKRFFSRNV